MHGGPLNVQERSPKLGADVRKGLLKKDLADSYSLGGGS